MSFKDIYAQDRAKAILVNALINKTVPQAYLFFGPEGVGKKLTALSLARALNCQNQAEDACDTCNSCKKNIKGIHPDVRLISPAEHSIDIEQIRDLKKWSSLKPFEGEKKVMIIDSANRMTKGAANAFLKLLEEPPPNNYIILICENLQNILPTIISRCQPIRFKPLSAEEVETILREKLSFAGEEAKYKSRFAGGSLSKAVKIDPKKNLISEDLDLSLIEKNIAEEKIIDYCKRFRDFKREEILEKLNQMMLMIRDLSCFKITRSPDSIIFPETVNLSKQMENISQMILINIFEIIQETIRMIQFNNTNPQLSMEGMFLKIKAAHEVTNNG